MHPPVDEELVHGTDHLFMLVYVDIHHVLRSAPSIGPLTNSVNLYARE